MLDHEPDEEVRYMSNYSDTGGKLAIQHELYTQLKISHALKKTDTDKGNVEFSQESESKIFITVSYIVLSYLACWIPFHIVFDCNAIGADLIPEPLYTTTFCLSYFNSTLIPFVCA